MMMLLEIGIEGLGNSPCPYEWSYLYGCCAPDESRLTCIWREINRVLETPSTRQEYFHFAYFIITFLMSYVALISYQNHKEKEGDDNE